jgi:hypothetical protein
MEDLLRSSIIGKEFVNYRKTHDFTHRESFACTVRRAGKGHIPVVVDSVDEELTTALSNRLSKRHILYGQELSVHMDSSVNDVLDEIRVYLCTVNYQDCNNPYLSIGLEDGSLPNPSCSVGELYKKHRNSNDKILYILLTKETNIIQYIQTIVMYLFTKVKSWWRQ